MKAITIKALSAEGVLQIISMDCSPLPQERDSVYLNFYRFFRDTCWVAVEGENEAVIGFALGLVDQTDPTHGYLNYLFVKSDYRRAGVGRRLLQQFEASAQQKGCKLITLLTGRTENIAYYTRHGYAINHELRPFTEDDAVYNYYYKKKNVSLLVKTL